MEEPIIIFEDLKDDVKTQENEDTDNIVEDFINKDNAN